jgi:hypothetical protein
MAEASDITSNLFAISVQVLFRYPEGAAAQDPVPINLGDLRRLRPGQFLNDNLIDFWLKYSVNNRFENAARDPGVPDGEEPGLLPISKHVF